jgi:excisionase family DNA binding protein
MKMEVPIAQKYTLSIEEASALTGIGHDQLYDWANTESAFPVFKIGKKYVIESSLLHEWLKTRCKNRVGMESTRVMRILKRRAQG